MTTLERPDYIVWDITYACPLRCEHCYSESGRRPTRQLGHDEILRVTDRIIALGPSGVGLAGCEALVIKGIFEVIERLLALAPPGTELSTSDNKAMRMHPDQVASGTAFRGIAVEPDGAVRAMCIYEGVVGNLLTDEPRELWRRVLARWSDPFVVETLRPVRTMWQWAEATRRIDYHFGTEEDRVRIDRRAAFAVPASV